MFRSQHHAEDRMYVAYGKRHDGFCTPPATPERLRARYTLDDAMDAQHEWGCNCGPAALAAIFGLTLAEIRPHMGNFEKKRYTNPSLMFNALTKLCTPRNMCWYLSAKCTSGEFRFPAFGLARIQWHGPWMHMLPHYYAAARHSHWVASARVASPPAVESLAIFDVNAIKYGGWITFTSWQNDLVPWLLKDCEPEADGQWSITHAIELQEPEP